MFTAPPVGDNPQCNVVVTPTTQPERSVAVSAAQDKIPTGSIGSKWSPRAAPICRDDRRRVANLFRTQPQPRRNRDFPDHAESSLMAQSDSLLTRKIFPVRSRRELPRTGLKLMSYLARLLGPERLHRRKLPVFSQLAGNLPAFPMARTRPHRWESG